MGRPIQNFGNLKTVIDYLNGSDHIEDRLKKASDIFFIEMDVLVEYKEEVVLSWLTDLISSAKVLQYPDEVLAKIWSTLENILSSKRLKALVSSNLIDALSSDFSQTLLTAASNTGIQQELKESLFSMCCCLLQMPTLSPQILRNVHQLYENLVSWLVKRLLNDNDLILLNQFSKASLLNMRTGPENFSRIFQNTLYFSLYLDVRLEEDYNKNENAREYRERVDIFLSTVLFSAEKMEIYQSILSNPLRTDNKKSTKEAHSLYCFLASCVESTSFHYGSNILKKFLVGFFKSYKTRPFLAHGLIVKTMHFLGISFDMETAEAQNSVVSLNISQTFLDDAAEGVYLVSILESILLCNIDTKSTLANNSLEQFLQKLSIHILKPPRLSEDNLKALSLIIAIVPTTALEVPQLLPILISEKTFDDSSYHSYDQVLCEVLQIHRKMRKLPSLYNVLSGCLMTDSRNERRAPETLFYYKGNQLLSPRFIDLLTSFVHAMGIQMTLDFMNSIDLSLRNCKMDREKENKESANIIMTVWLATRCLSAISIMDGMSSTKIAHDVARTMNNIADKGISTLVKWFLSLEQKEPVVGRALMNLIFVWSELNITFSDTETGYREKSNYKVSEMSSSKSAVDFFPQVPFIDNASFGELVSVLESDMCDAARFSLLQMVFQKVFLLCKQRVMNGTTNVGITEDDNEVLSQCLDFIFSINDRSNYEESTNLVAFYLPSIMDRMKSEHLSSVTSLMVSGFYDGSDSWFNFGRSVSFKRSKSLQIVLFSDICQRIERLLGGGKRKCEEEELLDTRGENCEIESNFLSRKILSSLSSCWTDGKSLNKSFSLLAQHFNGIKKSRKLSFRSENEIISSLKLLECFPVHHVSIKLLKGITLLSFVISIEEGIHSGRRNIVSLAINLLNKVLSTRDHSFIFQLLMKESVSMMISFGKEIELVLGSSKIAGHHLPLILDPLRETSFDADVIEQLLGLMKSFTDSFISWTCDGEEELLLVTHYIEGVLKLAEESGNNETFFLTVLFVTVSLRKMPRKTLMATAMTPIVSLVLRQLNSISMSELTPVMIAASLSTFTIGLSLESNKENPKNINKGNITEENYAIDWNNLVMKGMELCHICLTSDVYELRKLCFLFSVGVITSRKRERSKNLYETAWKFSLLEKHPTSELQNCINRMFEEMPLNYYKSILGNLSSEIKKKRKLGFCTDILTKATIIIELRETRSEFMFVKNSFVELLFKNLPFKFVNTSIVGKEEFAVKILELFDKVFRWKPKNVTDHVKSFVFFLYLHLDLDEIALHNFTKIFHAANNLLRTILEHEDRLVKDRIPTVLEAATQLALSLMNRSCQDLNLEESEIRELESCANALERTVLAFKLHATYIMNVSPFYIAKIADAMQKTTLEPIVKASLERTIFVLFDHSYNYSIQHVLVTLPAPLRSIMKHLYSLFMSSYKFSPKES